ncbi:MAG: hypothetical protein A3G52_04365 [Candidatus Taylorbacteria bacterium RIFCSPLOWO2_12_FULL_43_20]|uniref:Uncharacterized protein n=1 Tax=Candidatus Taylorbacteria bacterium RIFCSPLOWO2_12_FULL_43_20 TaxID=1802332 RepID=A0A1G2P264_9BACT|nr:MAG: hypothetical protein A2825_01410 [Candidatus Taylorbacteria bacterium RIFCSPHIGHO2_01_FULL_43_120]OHA23543.1 MAG: hypothetical protein A3B98_02030 [Candidatus Taylorbacteria bacterium RIFCSPHIGHO2_02_FULL_43_55]OHA30269.1 MAG: hypothetical protein A3E92_04315 [Candidatus Taylorbacteria bacterium RIFCSPHIGHO2_12_FULL_42_34]OHA41671.1 MAG: hypothetical protein A3G52_04365 [Candidatus Taylorbacteria bacterium RIFCSPLOWO2_12_FULL_43_20]
MLTRSQSRRITWDVMRRKFEIRNSKSEKIQNIKFKTRFFLFCFLYFLYFFVFRASCSEFPLHRVLRDETVMACLLKNEPTS